MNTPNGSLVDESEMMSEWHEPFPEPQTYPTGWDLSEFKPASMPVAAVEEDYSTLPPSKVKAAIARFGDFVSSLSHSRSSR
jgi:hypothetical protein